jgi:hypothetical protein
MKSKWIIPVVAIFLASLAADVWARGGGGVRGGGGRISAGAASRPAAAASVARTPSLSRTPACLRPAVRAPRSAGRLRQ